MGQRQPRAGVRGTRGHGLRRTAGVSIFAAFTFAHQAVRSTLANHTLPPRSRGAIPEFDAHMMEFIRSKAGKFIIFPTVVFFLLFMVWGIIAETGQTAPKELGSVNG